MYVLIDMLPTLTSREVELGNFLSVDSRVPPDETRRILIAEWVSKGGREKGRGGGRIVKKGE